MTTLAVPHSSTSSTDPATLTAPLASTTGSAVAAPPTVPAPQQEPVPATDPTPESTAVETVRDLRRRSTSALLAFAHGLPEHDGRRAVLTRVVDVNMPVAEAIAARYRRRGVAEEDLQQAAYVGLCKAVHRFDPEQSEDLLTFAVPTIRGEVQRYFRDHTWVVRPPRRLQELTARVRSVREQLEQQVGREPSLGELAEALDVDPATCDQVLVASEAMHALSLDRPVDAHGDGTATLADLVGEDDRLDLVEDYVVLRPLIAALGPREQQLLHLRFVQDRSQSEIGEELGVTQTQVSRLLRRILGDLRRALDAHDVVSAVAS